MKNLKSLFFLIFFNFYLFFRQRQIMNGGGSERERETQNPKQAPGSELSAQCGACTHRLQDHDLSGSQMLNQLSHPGAPRHFLK